MKVGSLFSGIGGFDLGLERAGMQVIWNSEIDPYASAVLKKHWPHVPNLGDIHGITGPVERPDVICGGFPCQPFSSSGKRLGKDDNRYLWPEMLRVIQELQPTWVCGENVARLDGMALDDCIADLEACGYEVGPPLEIPACAVGADHIRPRIWFLAHAERGRKPLGRHASGVRRERQSLSRHATSKSEDSSGGMGAGDGLPNRMDRLRCLGNAIHPDIAEVIGRAIMAVA